MFCLVWKESTANSEMPGARMGGGVFAILGLLGRVVFGGEQPALKLRLE